MLIHNHTDQSYNELTLSAPFDYKALFNIKHQPSKSQAPSWKLFIIMDNVLHQKSLFAVESKMIFFSAFAAKEHQSALSDRHKYTGE